MEAAKILIVDDEKFVRRTISRVLSSEGFATFEASNGPDALRMAQEQPFDLMILDIVMDGMDGFQVIRTLRDQGILLPVFVLSGRQADNDKILALGIGADDYITKPFSTTVLCAKVKGLPAAHGPVQPAEREHSLPWALPLCSATRCACSKTARRSPCPAKRACSSSIFSMTPIKFLSKEQIYHKCMGQRCGRRQHHHGAYPAPAGQNRSGRHTAELLRTIRGVGYQFVI